jgi:hypothetical protein
MIMQKLTVIILCFLCVACAGVAIPLEPINSSSLDSISFEFVDLRPEKEKAFRPSKRLEGPPCHFYGDKEFNPDRILALKDALIKNLEQKLVGQKIEINSFEFLACIPGMLKGQDMGGLFGLVGIALSDISYEGDMFICSLKATVNGQLISISDSEPITGTFVDSPITKKEGNRLMQRIFDRFVLQVEKTLEQNIQKNKS